MTQPSFACPRCGYTTFLPSDVNAGYCPQCRWWTGDSLLGSEDVLAQAEIDGPFATTRVIPPIVRERVMADQLGRLAARYGLTADEYVEAVERIMAHQRDEAYTMEPLTIRGDGSGEALPEMVYCAEHDLFDCWYAHDPTRAEVETDWFGAPITADAPEPKFRVARFVQALRRFRHP